MGPGMQINSVGSQPHRTGSRTFRMAGPAITTDTERHQGGHGNRCWDRLRRTCPFQDTPWRDFPMFPSNYASSPYNLSLTTWIVLIALHGASRVNKGPNEIALHTASISETNWQISIGLMPENKIAAFAETTLHQETYRRRYR